MYIYDCNYFPNELESYTRVESDTFVYEWRIIFKSKLPINGKVPFYSPEFCTRLHGTQKYWALSLKSSEESCKNSNKLSLKLSLCHVLGGDVDAKVTTLLKFYILNQHGKKELIWFSTIPHIFETFSSFTVAFNKTEVIHNINETNCALTIYCEVTEIGEPITIWVRKRVALEDKKSKKILDKYRSLFGSEINSDVTLVALGREFRVHREILAERSPIFSVIFKQNEFAQNHRVTMKKIKPTVLHKVLEYIYKNEISNFDGMTIDLLEVAHRYQLDGLMEICVKSLLNSINSDNFMRILFLAERIKSNQLYLHTMDFIVKNKNQLINRGDFRSLEILRYLWLEKWLSN